MLENNAFLHYKSTAFRCHERLPLHSMKRMVFHVGYGYISGCSLFSFTHDRKGDLLSITDYQQIALKRSKTEDAVRRNFWNSFAGCMDICQPKLSAAALSNLQKVKHILTYICFPLSICSLFQLKEHSLTSDDPLQHTRKARVFF